MKTIHCPLDCLPSFREVWEDYRVNAQVKGLPRVLDIGANVGAFSLMARELWPTCEVTAYEPNPELFPFLVHNVGDFATCVNAAVSRLSPPLVLLNDGPNRMCSRLVGNESHAKLANVEVLHPSFLPDADIVKIDVEGGEHMIIEVLPFIPLLLMVEYHTEFERIMIGHALHERMSLMHHKVARPGLGVMHFGKV